MHSVGVHDVGVHDVRVYNMAVHGVDVSGEGVHGVGVHCLAVRSVKLLTLRYCLDTVPLIIKLLGRIKLRTVNEKQINTGVNALRKD